MHNMIKERVSTEFKLLDCSKVTVVNLDLNSRCPRTQKNGAVQLILVVVEHTGIIERPG